METFFDIIKKPDFRACVMQRLANNSKNPGFTFPNKLPMLYRYRSLSSYAINDILNEQLTTTAIGEFNDLFDGTMHIYGSDEEIKSAAEQKWAELEGAFSATNQSEEIIKDDYYVSLYEKHFYDNARHTFGFLDFLGTYVCCFSEKMDSTLMWSHYANANKGICIAYDFNKLNRENILQNLIFPVSYSNMPVDISDLLDDEYQKSQTYPIETAVLCAALNKATAWSYENEWRLLLVLESMNNKDNTKRVPINIKIKPSAIYFGYHFLKSCFYYDFKDVAERNACRDNIENINRLLEYLDTNQIPAFLMMPTIGTYTQRQKKLDIKSLQNFMIKHIEDSDMTYYQTVQDYLLKLK